VSEGEPGGAAAPRLVIATRSPHKLRELRELLRLERAEVVSLDELGVPGDPIEDGETFEANALIKVRFAARATGLPSLADDSGIEVDALDGRPGVRSRRYAGEDATDEDNNRKMLEELHGAPPERRGARYVCVLAFARPDPGDPDGEPSILTTWGTCRGRIALAPRGSGGFGYDPIFEPEQEPVGGRTLGEWSAEDKNRISHRAMAAREMSARLAAEGF
jgi:XTP/dITP diphosphohydrolase